MKKKLTIAGIEKLKAGKARREIGDAGAPGLYLVLQPSGHKSWAMRFRRPNGKGTKLTLGPYRMGDPSAHEPAIGHHLTLTEARRLAGGINQKRGLGIDVAVEGRRKAEQGVSFASAAKDFIENHRVRKTGERPRDWRQVAKVLGLSYPKASGDPHVLRDSLIDRWSNRPIGSIDGHDVHAAIAEAVDAIPGLALRHDRASDSRGRRMATALSGLFRWCMRHRRAAMKANPTIGAYRPPPPPSRERVLSPVEIKLLWEKAQPLPYPYGYIVRLLLLTGCRRNEIVALEWDELSDDLSMISLPGRRTKNGLPHTISLPPMAQAILSEAKRIEGCPWVWSTSGKRPASRLGHIKDCLDAALSIPPWRFHDLRRTAATGMAEIGVPPHIVESALNHVSGAKAGVAGTYNRALYLGERRNALERWAARIEAIVLEKPANVVALAKRR